MDEQPTLQPWALASIDELLTQLARLRTGRACRVCRGAGTETLTGSAGTYERACNACDGNGMAAHGMA